MSAHYCSSCGQDAPRNVSHCRNHDGIPRCDRCGQPADWLDEADHCEDCIGEEMAAAWADYQGERGCRGYEDARADLLAAGRGHLVRRA